MTETRWQAVFRIRSEAAQIEARARTVAVEQSVEMPVGAIEDAAILNDIVGRVDSIADLGGGVFEARVGLAAATVEADAAQLLNMAFGNTSLHDDVTLTDIVLPPGMEAAFGGPTPGLSGLRARLGVTDRALTCSALKPQGLGPERLADLAERFALGALDFIKDDHGIADQAYAPFAARVPAIAAAVRRAARATGHPTRYLPSLSGTLEHMHRQIRLVREEGLDTVLIAPMLSGVATLQALVRAWPDVAFMAHPTLGGAARIAPELLFGKLFRLFGADATIFPNFGGRFGYSPATCLRLAENARSAHPVLRASVPVPAGGMTIERVPEILDFFGTDVMLLLGGSLLEARERLTEATAAFTAAVARHERS